VELAGRSAANKLTAGLVDVNFVVAIEGR
jgi:hypothetical protein